jgi:hypothetical protein
VRAGGSRGARVLLATCAVAAFAAAACGTAPAPQPTARLTPQLPRQLPDTIGWGVHVLALERAPDGGTWAGTYGAGIYVLRPGAAEWEHIAATDEAGSIASAFINSIAFGADTVTIWYGTVGNGFGRSTDGGRTWRSWTVSELGASWLYVAPAGVHVRRDTVYVATSGGLRLSGDGGETWRCVVDAGAGTAAAASAGRADACAERLPVLPSKYLLSLDVAADGGIWAGHLQGLSLSRDGGRSWQDVTTEGIAGARVRAVRVLADSSVWAATEAAVFVDSAAAGEFQQADIRIPGFTGLPGSPRAIIASPALLPPVIATSYGMIARTGVGDYRVYYVAAADRYRPAGDIWAATWWGPPYWPVGGSAAGLARVLAGDLPMPSFFAGAAAEPEAPRQPWFGRPVAEADGNPYVDATYRYGSTMGGRVREHQGIQFNNPAGTPVRAVGAGVVVYAGAAEAGSLTVAIRHDTRADGRHIFSTYHNNSVLEVGSGQRVQAGDVIARVGGTGRATNEHLHLGIHVAPTTDSAAIVNPAERDPPYTVNPQLWIEPLPGTGVVAGRVFNGAGEPVRGARVYGLVLPHPEETPFSFAETYGERTRGSPSYGEHFAVGDVPAGDYTVGVLVDGRRVWQRIRVRAGQVSWVELRP